MADGSTPPAPAASIDTGQLRAFVGDLRDEANGIGGLKSGLADVSNALPGTKWQASCDGVNTSVTNALNRIKDRLNSIADSVEKVNKDFQMTDQQFADDLKKIGLQQ